MDAEDKILECSIGLEGFPAHAVLTGHWNHHAGWWVIIESSLGEEVEQRNWRVWNRIDFGCNVAY